ncbi:MAG: SUMF1/EgtB/PvdO family nonheme iron enzyme, partial [Deltaproteobacteria bacterium]|nr:SUMF1/EgtB/PvdO family nonheme iron enzyme [Deltaproteobacteria bacterium]
LERVHGGRGERLNDTIPVDSSRNSLSKDGNLYGFIGNVWEWVKPSPREALEVDHLVRLIEQKDQGRLKGGSYRNRWNAEVQAGAIFSKPKDKSTNHIGFRMVLAPVK